VDKVQHRLDAMTVDREKLLLFHRTTSREKAMDGFLHSQLRGKLEKSRSDFVSCLSTVRILT
jgi:hypothetical protein